MKQISSPHIFCKDTVNKMIWHLIIALIPAAVMGVYIFGLNAFYIILASTLAAFMTDVVLLKLVFKKVFFKPSAVATGMLVALIMPASAPIWLAIFGGSVSIIVKHVFGAKSQVIFNPALTARAIMVAAWPALMTRWIYDGVTAATPLAVFNSGGAGGVLSQFGNGMIISMYKTFSYGFIGGTIGEVSKIAIIIGFAYLVIMKVVDLRIPISYVGVVALGAFIFRIDPLFYLLTGGLLFGAFFMATDPVTTPMTRSGRWIFGIGCGILTLVIRMFGSYPEGVMFSILFMNALTPVIDRLTRPKPFGHVRK